jgi:predicted ribosomally synthesized peptide with SipW-like signal peptide
MKLRTIVVVGGLGVAAIALIGAGAAATFTQDTTSTQKITAGTMNVVLSAPGASGNNTPTITLPDEAPVGSTFATPPTVITITNNGNIPVSEIALKLADTNTNSTLQSEAWACFYSDGEILVNEPLTTVEGYGPATVGGGVAPGGTDTYTMIIYAGSIDTGCGAAFTGFSGGAYTTNETYTGSAPTRGGNPSAASLTNGAQGGTLTPSTTVTYTG